MDNFVFPARATGGVTLELSVLGRPTLAYFKEDFPSIEKVEAVRRSMEACALTEGHKKLVR